MSWAGQASQHDADHREPDEGGDSACVALEVAPNDQRRQALHRMVESGPLPAVHGVVRWRLIDLAQWVFDEFRISISKQTLSRELRAVGFRKLSARPRHHAQDAAALAAFKKTSPPASTRSPSATRQASR